jgi:DNA-binding transcriptional MocR family regulator
MVYECCRQGILKRQLPLLRRHYQEKRDVMTQALASEFRGEVSWPAPRGGFFLWATLPPQIDGERMITRAAANGVIYVAGEAFFVDGSGHNIIRLSFSAPSHEKIREGVARLAATVREELAATTTSAVVR